MEKESLVSIIITCYNQADVIERTLYSVLEQSYSNWECIIVDDGSCDNSAGVIKGVARSDKRICYMHQYNKGVASARNFGFSKAKGAYIQFLDGDDLLHPKKLELQINHFLTDETIDVSYSNHQFYLVAENTFKTFEFVPINEYPLEQFLYNWFDGVSLPLHAPIYKRSIWQVHELPYPSDYNERCEDWVFLVLVAAKCAKFAYYNEILCTYCVGENNYTKTLEDWNVAAILAAQYLEDRIPVHYRDGFVKNTILRTLRRYHQSKRCDVLHSSKNWRLGNFITKPFFNILNFLKR